MSRKPTQFCASDAGLLPQIRQKINPQTYAKLRFVAWLQEFFAPPHTNQLLDGADNWKKLLYETGLVQGGLHEAGEKRVRIEWLGLQFRVKLDTDKPGMIGSLDDFWQ